MQMQMQIPPITVPMTSIQSCGRCLSLPPIPSCQRLKISFSVQGHTVTHYFLSVQFSSSFKFSHNPFPISQLLQSFAQINSILKHSPAPAFHDWSRSEHASSIYRSSRVPILLPCCRCPLYIKVLFHLPLSHPFAIYLTGSFLFQGLEAIL